MLGRRRSELGLEGRDPALLLLGGFLGHPFGESLEERLFHGDSSFTDLPVVENLVKAGGGRFLARHVLELAMRLGGQSFAAPIRGRVTATPTSPMESSYWIGASVGPKAYM
jgi:hypothetical protein